MRWEHKMDEIVKNILGIEYTCIVDTDKSFTIFENDAKVVTRQTIYNLASHWKHELAETLKFLYDEKIRDVMLKY
jgi:hypothetical protein